VASRSARELRIDVSTEGVRLPVSLARVRDASERTLRAERVKDALVSITFVGDRRMAALNREHLGHAGTTDVISFGFAPTAQGSGLVGDIYISPAQARRNALAHGARMRDELLRLVVHGTLHIVGHEHPVDGDRETSAMWRKQERIVRRLVAAS
jgi:probable rRNA maturation factor